MTAIFLLDNDIQVFTKKALFSIRLSPSLCLDSISLSENDVPHYSLASKLPRSIYYYSENSCECVYASMSVANYIFSNTMDEMWKRFIMMRRSYKIWLLHSAFIDFPAYAMTLFISSLLKSSREGLHHLNFLLHSSHTHKLATTHWKHVHYCHETQIWMRNDMTYIFLPAVFFFYLFLPSFIHVTIALKRNPNKKLSRGGGRRRKWFPFFLIFKRCCCHFQPDDIKTNCP